MAKRTLYRVMLVEDNPGDARLVREALAEHPAFSFQVAHFLRIEQALKFLERDTVDVVLLDYELPDVEDLDGLTRIIAAAPNLPVVMLTGLDDEAAGLRMVQHGAQDYLVKGTVDWRDAGAHDPPRDRAQSDVGPGARQRGALHPGGGRLGRRLLGLADRQATVWSCRRAPRSSSAFPRIVRTKTWKRFPGASISTTSAGFATPWRPT